MSAAKNKPHFEDMGHMTDIHDRMHRLLVRSIPMNWHDENNLNDLLIPGQDEAYACGRERGQREINSELLEALQYATNGLRSMGFECAKELAAIAKATGSAS